MKNIKFLVLVVCFICLAVIVSAAVDKPDRADGVPRVGDRVIYFTDADGDGFFEKNPAIVSDDTHAVARIQGLDQPEPGQRVNIWVFPSAEALPASESGSGRALIPYRVDNVKRGRAVGQYEALVTSN